MVINWAAFIIVIVAALADLFVPVILGLKYPGYNHFRDTVSTLGTKESPVRRQESINLFIVGILFLVFAFGQGFSFKNIGWSHILYICGIIAFGMGSIIAGIFPEDPKGSQESVSGKIHGIASGIGFIFLILNPLWAIYIDDFQKFSILNILLFVIGIITFILFMISEKIDTGWLKYTGLFQRLNLIILDVCLIANFSALIKTCN